MWWRAHHLCVLWRVNSLDIQLWAVDGGFKAFVQFSQNGSNAYSSQKKKLILGSAKKTKKKIRSTGKMYGDFVWRQD